MKNDELTYTVPELQDMTDPDDSSFNRDEIIPSLPGQSMTFTHKAMVPPGAPQVSGRVIHASVWIPRLTHWFFVWSKVNALFTWLEKLISILIRIIVLF